MQVTNQNPLPSPSIDNGKDAASTTRNESASAVPSPPSATSPSVPVTLVPSFELFNLTSTLDRIPPVRAEVIAETIRRLDSGQLQTPSALEQTARAILGE
jgi:hypothetical protein